MNLAAASFIYDQISSNEEFILCPAAGRTPTSCYDIFVKKMQHHEKSQLKLVMLDEWLGLPPNHPASCRNQIETQLIKPLSIEHHYLFDGSNAAETEMERFAKAGVRVIDFCVLGLGKNGHIGLNEPGRTLQPFCHRARLSSESLDHPMIQDVEPKPAYGITLGMKEILASKTILILVSGKEKKNAFLKLCQEVIDTQLPASFLWLHANTHCYYTKDVTRE